MAFFRDGKVAVGDAKAVQDGTSTPDYDGQGRHDRCHLTSVQARYADGHAERNHQTAASAQKRQIGVVSAAFLIFNRMIGTGIFATPSGILELSGSVGLSLFLWVAGMLIAAAGMAVYLEFGTAMPKNGQSPFPSSEPGVAIYPVNRPTYSHREVGLLHDLKELALIFAFPFQNCTARSRLLITHEQEARRITWSTSSTNRSTSQQASTPAMSSSSDGQAQTPSFSASTS